MDVNNAKPVPPDKSGTGTPIQPHPPPSTASTATIANSAAKQFPPQLHRSQSSQHHHDIQPHPQKDTQPPQKYPKIQAKPSQVQIKMKKPIPIAVLPKPSNKTDTKFNPNIKVSSAIKLKHEIGLSKKWVLPPRPRPGRKPVNTDDDDETKRQHLKEIHRGVKEMNMRESKSVDTVTPGLRSSHTSPNLKPQILPQRVQQHKESQSAQQPVSAKVTEGHVIEAGSSTSSATASVETGTTGNGIAIKAKDNHHISGGKANGGAKQAHLKSENKKSKSADGMSSGIGTPTGEETPETMKLKVEYLNKLKEQDLINNYIGVINNQIKQLDFIKNGYMTLDTLNQLNMNTKPGDATVSADTLAASQMTGNTTSTMTLNENMNTNLDLNDTTNITTTTPNDDTKDGINTPLFSTDLDSSIARRFNDLEAINNFNDLEKFLSYLNKSSNLIYRVTKNYNQNLNINEQIVKYLQLRTTFKNMEKKQKKMKKAKLGSGDNSNSSNVTSNDYLNLSNDKACPICGKTCPCFCLDIDRKFNENNWNESYK